MPAIKPDLRFPTDIKTPNKNVDVDNPRCKDMVSVVRGRNDYDVPPPPEEGTPEFQRDCELFIEAREAYRNRVWPTDYFTELGHPSDPTDMEFLFAQSQRLNRGQDVRGVTGGDVWVELVDFVSMDNPLDFHQWMRAHIVTNLVEDQRERSPQSCGFDFLGLVGFDVKVAETIEAALIEAFQVKYFYERPRPSHWFPAGNLVQEDLCPGHNAYVAGHSAVFAAIMETWSTMTDTLFSQELHAAGIHGSHARTGLGVHWPSDNDAGYQLAIRVARKTA